jgi:TolA-binding protein
MNKKAAILLFICLFLLVFQAEPGLSQTKPPDRAAKAAAPGFNRLQSGLALYQEGRWREAAAELRRAQEEALDPELKGEAYYWISLAELAAGDYRGAIRDMDALETTAPESKRMREIPYHKGRALYHLSRYDEALMLLKLYADRIGGAGPLSPGSSAAARKSAALYWIGECLYAMGQLDYARDVFTIVTADYPGSANYEASSYRLGLINQKKIEEELLGLLKWSHEESLRAIEEYQRRERSYDQALIAYQKRIAELLKDTHIPDLEAANAQYRRQLQEAEARIRALESGPESPPPVSVLPSAPLSQEDKDRRLLFLRASAAELSDELSRLLEAVNRGGGR